MFSCGILRSFSNFVTGIVSIRTVTLFGFGKCEYQFQVHAPAQQSKKSPMIAGPIRRGCALSRRFHLSRVRASQRGCCQEKFPKACAGIGRTNRPAAANPLIALERGSGGFLWGFPARGGKILI